MNPDTKEFDIQGRVGPGDSFMSLGSAMGIDHKDALRSYFAECGGTSKMIQFLVRESRGQWRMYKLDNRPHFMEI